MAVGLRLVGSAMIVVKIELHSAITGKVTQLGQMYISNDGTGDFKRGNYLVEVMRKNSDSVQRQGYVPDYPRQSYTVWELVRRSLESVFSKKVGMAPEFGEQITVRCDEDCDSPRCPYKKAMDDLALMWHPCYSTLRMKKLIRKAILFILDEPRDV